MNHKRKGPKSTRAGCLLCKPHKHQGRLKEPRSKRAKVWLAEPIDLEPAMHPAELHCG